MHYKYASDTTLRAISFFVPLRTRQTNPTSSISGKFPKRRRLRTVQKLK